MPRLKVLTASAAATLLLVGVVAVRGGTAADDGDLAGPAPAPTVEPSEEPDPGFLLEANGLAGLRLGTRPSVSVDGVGSGDGCQVLWEPLARAGDGPSYGWSTQAWVREDRVVSVVVSAWDGASASTDELRTWLGPTLGSPVQAAQELPGARTAVTRPFDDEGPTVTVVTVPLGGVEVVFGDADTGFPDEPGVQPRGVPGPITSIEVRRTEGRECDAAAAGFFDRAPVPDGVVVDAGGVGPVRLGAAADELVRTGVLQADGVDPVEDPGCRWLFAEDLQMSVQAVDGLVTSMTVPGATPTDLGLGPEATLDELVARFPELAAEREQLGWQHSPEVDLGPSRLRLDLSPEMRAVEDLEQPVLGGELRVSGMTLTAADAQHPDHC